jgi:Ca2+-binding RTX toxin-like protein
MAILRGTGRVDQLGGTTQQDFMFGLGGNDILFGFKGSDRIYGGVGNDYLDGGIGKDRLIGGRGNDIYIVNTIGDRTIERGNQGNDTVQAFINWALGTNVENLILQDNAIRGRGNNLDNIIKGNTVNNILYGGNGADTLYGENGADKLYGGNGTDTVYGGNGADFLDGGSGVDTLVGGAGNDTYVLDNPQDKIAEENTKGIDTILLSISGGLQATWENLTLIGSAVEGFGNESNNIMVGNDLDNTLYGKGGADTLTGGAGDDNLLGDNGNDTLSGEIGLDVLLGSAGNDTLTGGSGADGFLFGDGQQVFTNAGFGIDQVTDFSVVVGDKIVLSQKTFGTNLVFASEVNDATATISSANIVFSRASKTLFYNPNGSASGFGAVGASGAFAVINIIDNTTLFTSSFLVVS